MADTGIFATTAEVQRKVGFNASTTANAEAYINQFMTEVESYINAVCDYNFSDAYTGLNVDVKALLKMAASSFAAMMVINYDDANFPKATGMQTRLNFLAYQFELAMDLLKDKKKTNFIKGA